MRRSAAWLRPPFLGIVTAMGLMCLGSVVAAQQGGGTFTPPPGLPDGSLPDGPTIINTHEIAEVRMSVVTRGLKHPGGMAFLPNGDILVTEKDGPLRMIRDGVLAPEPIAGVPTDVLSMSFAGMMDVAIHPDFEQNRLVYVTYTRQVGRRVGTVALIRGRLEDMSLVDVEDVFVADPWGGFIAATSITFTPDGFMFLAIGGGFGVENEDGSAALAAVGGQYHAMKAQDPMSHVGKILRLRPDGTVPDDNPFVGRAGYKPEIYSMGHRNQQGMALHPVTGALWAAEHGPQGGGRAQHHRARQELRLATRVLRPAVRGPAHLQVPLERGSDGALHALGPVDRPVRAGLLYRRSFSEMEGRRLRRVAHDWPHRRHRTPRTDLAQRQERGSGP